MTYFVIRHKASGKFMPQLSGKGYTAWTPVHPNKDEEWPQALVPRLFHTKAAATAAASHWYRGIAYSGTEYNEFTGDYNKSGEVIYSPQSHRKQGDLEVLEVELKLVGQMELSL